MDSYARAQKSTESSDETRADQGKMIDMGYGMENCDECTYIVAGQVTVQHHRTQSGKDLPNTVRPSN